MPRASAMRSKEIIVESLTIEFDMKFNSQICTTREQSERLLALGLKKETADMRYAEYYIGDNFDGPYKQWQLDVCPPLLDQDIPAWSLHRLMCLVFNSGGTCVEFFEDDDAYEILIYKIEMRIKEGYFNKEYLVNQAEIDEHCKGVLEYLDYIRGEEE